MKDLEASSWGGTAAGARGSLLAVLAAVSEFAVKCLDVPWSHCLLVGWQGVGEKVSWRWRRKEQC